MHLLLVLSLLSPIACKRFKRLGGHILDDVILDLVYCPMIKHAKKHERLSVKQEETNEIEKALKEPRLTTGIDADDCMPKSIKGTLKFPMK